MTADQQNPGLNSYVCFKIQKPDPTQPTSNGNEHELWGDTFTPNTCMLVRETGEFIWLRPLQVMDGVSSVASDSCRLWEIMVTAMLSCCGLLILSWARWLFSYEINWIDNPRPCLGWTALPNAEVTCTVNDWSDAVMAWRFLRIFLSLNRPQFKPNSMVGFVKVFLSHQLPFLALSHFSSILHSSACLPRYASPLPPTTPLLKQSSITLILPCYPSLNLFPSSWPIQQSGSLWLAGGHPTPFPVSHPARSGWAETDSSMSKSIIIFSQCNLIPEDIL